MRNARIGYFCVSAVVAACSAKSRDHVAQPAPDAASSDMVQEAPVAASCGDTQTVLDQYGNVFSMCDPSQACLLGKCVSPCEWATAKRSSIGCSFVVSTPSFTQGHLQPCFAVFITNSWSTPVTIDVSLGAQTMDVTHFGWIATSDPNVSHWTALPASGLPPNEVAVLFLSVDPGGAPTCPVPTATGTTGIGNGNVDATGRGVAFKITTSQPVVAYDMLPFGGALSYLPSASLLLPASAWSTQYVAAVPKTNPQLSTSQPRFGQITASMDNTTVKIRPTTSLPAGTMVDAAPAGQLTTYTLNAGEFIQWQDSGDMSGSLIKSDKPILFEGGNVLLCLTSMTSGGGGCDSSHQVIPPLPALGWEYIGAPFGTRAADNSPESIPYRIVIASSGTMLTFDPAISGVLSTFDAGQVIDFETKLAFRVSSQDDQHPFYLAQMMTGCNISSKGAGCLGDEEFVNVLPPEQFLSKYLFFTDPSYSTTQLTLVRKSVNGVFKDVTVDCVGAVSGWKNVGVGGLYQAMSVDLIRRSVPNGSCANGPHSATSDAPFGLTIWGLDEAASYAYPAGGRVDLINPVSVPIQ